MEHITGAAPVGGAKAELAGGPNSREEERLFLVSSKVLCQGGSVRYEINSQKLSREIKNAINQVRTRLVGSYHHLHQG